MSSRREVFVEILYNPKKRRSLKRTCPERHATISPPVSPTLSESYNSTSHKKRKLSPTLSEQDISNDPSRQPSPVSPTASEYGLNASGSRSTPPETRSPTFSEGIINLDEEPSQNKESFQVADPFIYDQAEDDVDETDDLVIPGESQVDDGDNDEDIPVRILDDFVIYAAGTLEVVSTAELLQLEYSRQKYLASGLVRPWTDPEDANVEDSEDSDDDESSSQRRASSSDENSDRVTLSTILELSLHASSDGEYPIDPKLYIRTKYAWYILNAPSDKYYPFYVPLWRCQRLLHLLVVASINNSRVTYPQFVTTLPQLDEAEDEVVSSINIMGRVLKEADLKSDDVSSYIMSNLPDLCAERGIRISRVPLVRDVMGPTHYEFDVDMRPGKKSNSAGKGKSTVTKSSKSGSQSQVKTFLTPIVNRIARDLFEGSLEVAQYQLDEIYEEQNRATFHHKGHYSNPIDITFKNRFRKYEGCYQSAVIDGVTYNMGDVIMVAPDKMDSSKAYSVNKYANKWWFCQIRYFFEKESRSGKTKMFHGLWFNHGSKTLLQETSHSKALYLLGSCDDNFVTAIVKKCNFRILRPGDEEVVDDVDSQSNDFHCGLYCKDDDTAFVDLPDNALNVEEDERTCFACRLEKEKEKAAEVHLGQGSLTLHGLEYHIYDFIYFIPSHHTRLLGIAQIVKITQRDVIVCLLGRCDEFRAHLNLKSSKEMDDDDLVFDDRRLYVTDEYLTVPLHKLDGICFVRHLTDTRRIEGWIEGNDHFYLNQKLDGGRLCDVDADELACCEPCFKKELEARKRIRTYMRTNSKLVGLELFSGAGGLGVGMDLSGFVETKYAVEFSPSAAKTYAKNHPDTIVYCQDTNALLKHALTTEKGSKAKLMSLDGKTYCPPLPDKNTGIDFIFGGPPCQSFSLANHSKRRDDIRTTMPCNMLSYVEHYEPSYFLLENVLGLLAHKFYSNRETEGGTVETEIQAGMVKFVLRTLIALGYQVRFKVLQAAQYGVPQSRRRVIFWGARRGVSLPDFPVPVYAYEKGMHKVNLPTGTMHPPSRSRDPDNPHQYAPLPKITVNAAISDLPKFDWLNPHRVHAQTGRDKKTAARRREELGIASFAAANDAARTDWGSLPGFPNSAAYCAAPQNRFQRWLRRGMSDDEQVMGQYTTRFPARVIEATCTVPLTPGAHHRDLPADLLPAFIHKIKKNKRVIYGRMDGEGLFRCAVTRLSPVLKNQWPLHPSQKRIITVREAARCQGFPDDYEFESTNSKPSRIIEDQLKQIGNAVAVPFALALGKELGRVLVDTWEKKEREGSVAV